MDGLDLDPIHSDYGFRAIELVAPENYLTYFMGHCFIFKCKVCKCKVSQMSEQYSIEIDGDSKLKISNIISYNNINIGIINTTWSN